MNSKRHPVEPAKLLRLLGPEERLCKACSTTIIQKEKSVCSVCRKARWKKKAAA